jgi:Ser-Thr-rich glycosyl-phosphatidyl-inositol-anchored membrane family
MQFILSVATALALVASTLALQVTAPAEDANLDLSKDNKISWASVSSDPSVFNIVLTNMNVNPSVRIEIATNVQTSTGSYDFGPVSGAVPGENYRINLEGIQSNNQGILAQSGQFNVVAAGSSSTSSSSSSASFSSSTSSTSAITSSMCAICVHNIQSR